MSKNEDPQQPGIRQLSENLPSRVDEVSALASANAPFIYFDGAPNFGFMADGIMNITLEAVRFTRGPEGVVRDRVVVAHLRMGPTAANDLRIAIERGLAMLASPGPEGGSQAAH